MASYIEPRLDESKRSISKLPPSAHLHTEHTTTRTPHNFPIHTPHGTSSSSAAVALGKNSVLFSGRFQMLKLLGRGSRAAVVAVFDGQTQRVVALKEVSRTCDVAALHNEIRVLKKLIHPNIVSFDGWVESPYSCTLLTEVLAGGAVVDRIPENIGISEAQTVLYTRHLLHGLAHMHENGFVHRDVKLDNLCVHADNRTAKLIDFGSAVHMSDYVPNFFVGSLPYIAPELLALAPPPPGKAEHTYLDLKAVDIWASGICLVVMLTGRFPWSMSSRTDPFFVSMGRQPDQMLAHVDCSDQMRTLVRLLLCKDSRHRMGAKQAIEFLDMHWPPINRTTNQSPATLPQPTSHAFMTGTPAEAATNSEIARFGIYDNEFPHHTKQTKGYAEKLFVQPAASKRPKRLPPVDLIGPRVLAPFSSADLNAPTLTPSLEVSKFQGPTVTTPGTSKILPLMAENWGRNLQIDSSDPPAPHHSVARQDDREVSLRSDEVTRLVHPHNTRTNENTSLKNNAVASRRFSAEVGHSLVTVQEQEGRLSRDGGRRYQSQAVLIPLIANQEEAELDVHQLDTCMTDISLSGRSDSNDHTEPEDRVDSAKGCSSTRGELGNPVFLELDSETAVGTPPARPSATLKARTSGTLDTHTLSSATSMPDQSQLSFSELGLYSGSSELGSCLIESEIGDEILHIAATEKHADVEKVDSTNTNPEPREIVGEFQGGLYMLKIQGDSDGGYGKGMPDSPSTCKTGGHFGSILHERLTVQKAIEDLNFVDEIDSPSITYI